MRSYDVSYSWTDTWPILSMPKHSEGYSAWVTTFGKTSVTLNGEDVGDGSPLAAEINAYRNSMVSQVQSYLGSMDTAMQKMVSATANLAGNCAFKGQVSGGTT